MTDGAPPGKPKNLFNELQSMYSHTSLDTRGENAWAVGVKFFSLLQQQIPNEEEQKKLMSAWFKAVRDNDFRKFRRALNRYRRGPEPKPEEPIAPPTEQNPPILT